jgi:hypothetical protein
MSVSLDYKEDWKETFKNECIKMESEKLAIKSLPGRGSIKWCPEIECLICNELGIFSGTELDCGNFYECATASYCPHCKKVGVFQTEVNFAPYNQRRFLPIMKKKIIDQPNIVKKLKEASLCPACGHECYSYEKDLGGIDYYDNTWTVCSNPYCSWPGKHYENIERGPY